MGAHKWALVPTVGTFDLDSPIEGRFTGAATVIAPLSSTESVTEVTTWLAAWRVARAAQRGRRGRTPLPARDLESR